MIGLISAIFIIFNGTPATDIMPVFEENCSTIIYSDDAYHMISQEEIDLMARVVMSESSICGDDCKEAVATVILNRWMSPDFPNTITDVIRAPGQFSTQDNGAPNDACYLAVYSAIAWWGSDYAILPKSCYYFRSGYYHPWAIDYTHFDNMYFSLSKEAAL